MKSFGLAAALTLLSGLLLSLAHPSALPLITTSEGYILDTGWQEILAWFGLVPFLFVATRLRGYKLFLASFGLTTFYFFLSLYWINIAVTIYGNIHWGFSLLISLALAMLVGIQLAFGMTFGVIIHRRLKLPLSFTLPVSVVAWELLRNYFFTGFPWQNLAYSQHLNLPVLQTSAIWGIYGILFMLILCNTIMFELIRWWRNREQPLPNATATALLIAMVAFSYAYGVYRLWANEQMEAAAPKLKAAMVQGNIDQTIKNSSYRYARKILEVYTGLSEQIPTDTDLVVWPEAAYPYNIPRTQDSFKRLFFGELSLQAPWHMLVGAATYSVHEGERHYYNSGFLLSPHLQVLDAFDKSHLVPFGEYVPLSEIIRVGKVIPQAGMFYPGELGDGLQMGDKSLGVLICYEGIFPEIAREYARVGVHFLVNLTNDAWYGVSSAPFQHLAFYTFRAAETRKALLRVANTGITTAIDSSGRIGKGSHLFERTVVMATIPLLTERTIYSYIGDVPAWILVLLWFVWVLRSLKAARLEKK